EIKIMSDQNKNVYSNKKEEYAMNFLEEDFLENEIDFSLNLDHAGCGFCQRDFCVCNGKEEYNPPENFKTFDYETPSTPRPQPQSPPSPPPLPTTTTEPTTQEPPK
ncbi:hypothetical protein JTB14_001159, partial [Gonioctena quinquepunctata]